MSDGNFFYDQILIGHEFKSKIEQSLLKELSIILIFAVISQKIYDLKYIEIKKLSVYRQFSMQLGVPVHFSKFLPSMLPEKAIKLPEGSRLSVKRKLSLETPKEEKSKIFIESSKSTSSEPFRRSALPLSTESSPIKEMKKPIVSENHNSSNFEDEFSFLNSPVSNNKNSNKNINLETPIFIEDNEIKLIESKITANSHNHNEKPNNLIKNTVAKKNSSFDTDLTQISVETANKTQDSSHLDLPPIDSISKDTQLSKTNKFDHISDCLETYIQS